VLILLVLNIYWVYTIEANLCSFFLFICLYKYCRWRSGYQEGRIRISLAGLTPPHCCVCPMPDKLLLREWLVVHFKKKWYSSPISFKLQFLHILSSLVIVLYLPVPISKLWSLTLNFVNNSVSEWVGDCCLTPIQYFSAILWREQVNFQWDDDEIRFVLDQRAELHLHSASPLKQQSAGWRVAPLGHIIQIASELVFVLSP
jgi:hypothetical protein